MKVILVAAIILGGMSPAFAQTSIKGTELSPGDAARVDRQCDVLRFRQPSSLASKEPPPPEPGDEPSDPSAYWATGADGMDEALSNINLGTLSKRDCSDAGFYD